jgi:hypothetical protein
VSTVVAATVAYPAAPGGLSLTLSGADPAGAALPPVPFDALPPQYSPANSTRAPAGNDKVAELESNVAPSASTST